MGEYYLMDFHTWILVVIIIIASCILTIFGVKKYYANLMEQRYKKFVDTNFKKIHSELVEEAKKNLQQVDEKIREKQAEYDNLVSKTVVATRTVNETMAQYKVLAEQKVNKEIEEWARSAQSAATTNFQLQLTKINTDIKTIEVERNQLLEELKELQSERNAINEEILRTRAIEEKQDFYRIQLNDAAKEDIDYLISIINKFNNKETIYKLIWAEYLQKQFKAMMNRVLGNSDPKNVIYMIQNLHTHEIYIGKTKAEVSKRWTEHIKTSLNIGTISRSLIHKALFAHWDDFAFCILEEVPQEANLGDREKYYINFYKSNTYGYNIKSGG